MENPSNDVNGSSSPVNSEVAQTQEEVVATPEVVVANPTPPGAKTPPENLYAALAEERRLRKEAEDKLNNLTTSTSTDEIYSDEGKVLKQEIDTLKDKLELQELQEKYPQLKGLSAEFNEFRQDYPRHKGENVAKLFLSEKGLLESARVGLENPTGGTRTPVNPEMTLQDIENLRKTNYKKYLDMVKKGLIKI